MSCILNENFKILFLLILKFPVFQKNYLNSSKIMKVFVFLLTVFYGWKMFCSSPHCVFFCSLYLTLVKCSEVKRCPYQAGLSYCKSLLYSHEGLAVNLVGDPCLAYINTGYRRALVWKQKFLRCKWDLRTSENIILYESILWEHYRHCSLLHELMLNHCQLLNQPVPSFRRLPFKQRNRNKVQGMWVSVLVSCLYLSHFMCQEIMSILES